MLYTELRTSLQSQMQLPETGSQNVLEDEIPPSPQIFGQMLELLLQFS